MSDVEKYLAARLEGGSEWVGISSNAMVREAIGGNKVRQNEYPRDHADLARCAVTYARAPWSLKAIMLPRLTAYCEYAMNGWHMPSPPKPQRFAHLRRFFWDSQGRLRAFGARFNTE